MFQQKNAKKLTENFCFARKFIVIFVKICHSSLVFAKIFGQRHILQIFLYIFASVEKMRNQIYFGSVS
jgi:hypothetical protein